MTWREWISYLSYGISGSCPQTYVWMRWVSKPGFDTFFLK